MLIVTGIGRLVRDWEVRTSAGHKWASNVVAVPRDYDRSKSDFINVVINGDGRVDNITKFTNKGSKIGFVGRPEINIGNKNCPDCANEYTVNYFQVKVDNVDFLDSKADSKRTDAGDLDKSFGKDEDKSSKDEFFGGNDELETTDEETLF
jgi:single-stranded DNA-binding protein